MGLIFLLPLIGGVLTWEIIKGKVGPMNAGSALVALVAVGSVMLGLLVISLLIYLSWYQHPQPR